jgi:hypothetical protein
MSDDLRRLAHEVAKEYPKHGTIRQVVDAVMEKHPKESREMVLAMVYAIDEHELT